MYSGSSTNREREKERKRERTRKGEMERQRCERIAEKLQSAGFETTTSKRFVS
jgi:phage replication-related protein YjqB (UPF0714/DUF867 family)